MTTFFLLVLLVLYLGWGVFLIIGDFMDKSWQTPMYVVNLREKRGRILSCSIVFIKLFFWPLAYILKYF
jgi:hypothetical protein